MMRLRVHRHSTSGRFVCHRSGCSRPADHHTVGRYDEDRSEPKTAPSAASDAVFRLRHQVFVEEEQYMQHVTIDASPDRFDAYPTSANFVALVDEQIVGSIRFMERSAAGLSTHEFYDFTEQFAPAAGDGCSGIFLVVARTYRSTPRLVVSMMAMGYLWAASRRLTRLFGAYSTQRLAAFRRTGYRQVAPD